jgi:hypothetical protein
MWLSLHSHCNAPVKNALTLPRCRVRAPGLFSDHDRLAERLGQFLTDNARNDIHRPARAPPR